MLDYFGLSQKVQKPTRLSNILDIVLVKSPDLVDNVKIIPGISDHEAVSFDLKMRVTRNRSKPRQVMLFSKADLAQIRQHLSKHCNKFLGDWSCRSVQENWDVLSEFIQDAVKKFVPSKTILKVLGIPGLLKKSSKS